GGAPLVAAASEEAVGPLEDILRPADWIVDALLGTGARGRPRSPYDEAIRQANRAAARRLAVDWPSGLDCDTGEASGDSTFRADVTATFVALKPAATRPETQAWTGAVHVISIGILPCVVDDITRGDL